MITQHALFTEQVAKADDGVRAIFYELWFGFIPDILLHIDRVCLRVND